MKPNKSIFLLCPGNLIVLLVIFVLSVRNTFGLGEPSYVATSSSPNSFALCDDTAANILVDASDWPGVARAAGDLAADVNRVSGRLPQVVNRSDSSGKNVVIVGTVGKSELIDRLIRERKIDASEITGKWESFFLQVVSNPLPGVESALVICGSDKRGTIYGIYDLSEQIGVSPWYYWADVPAKHHDKLFIRSGKYVQGSPSVKYRGIFLNDEAPDLSNWIRGKYGDVPGMPGVANYGRGFYTNLFELMLRIRANYLWPAMWNNAFNEDDPENPRLADEYGIVMGTSHQEPMLRAQREWDRRYSRQYGSWNYARIPNVVSNFWREGVERNKNYESILTIGLRGANDTPMAPGGPEANKSLLEQIVVDQRKIIADVLNPDVTQVPQAWCLYKEVMDYYNAGMRVPDDVTLLWAEDNWGNVRRLPGAEERHRSGGAGVYYHFDYHGGPRSYQWINTSPIAKIWDQMSLTKQYGADRIWIVNVGHFKGYELPTEFFMSLAWDTSRWTNEHLDEFTRLWAEREFGPEHAAEIADIVSAYTQINGRRKPELLDTRTYSLVNYDEFDRVVAEYQALADKAEKINEQLPVESRDAFYELVLFPVKTCAGLNAMYLAGAKNALYASQGRASANDYAVQTRELFSAQTNLMNYFNTQFAGGRWAHFMDQPYIGYRSWNEPRQNNLDMVRLVQTEVPDAAAMGVAVEGLEIALTNGLTSLPQFDVFNHQKYYIDVFNKGNTTNSEFQISASEPWIMIEPDSTTQTAFFGPTIANSYGGTIKNDKRFWIGVNFGRMGESYIKAPKGLSTGLITISGPGCNVMVKITVFNPSEPTLESLQGFVEGNGYVSMEAEHYTKLTAAGSNRWIKIPNYGHTLSGMRADAPVDALATPGKDSPCLEYKMYLFNTGKFDVETTVGPTLNFIPGRPLRYAISFDDEAPQVVTIVPADFNAQNGNRNWEESVRNNGRRLTSSHTLATAGYHTLKIWMVDPAVVVEKIVVNTGGAKTSYLGPPESFRGGTKISTR